MFAIAHRDEVLVPILDVNCQDDLTFRPGIAYSELSKGRIPYSEERSSVGR